MNLDAFNGIPKASQDSRYKFPLQPPVNPMVGNTEVMYGKELNYSGGNGNIINIPLQMNYPFDEPLRSQTVFVTPYNQIKYSCCD